MKRSDQEEFNYTEDLIGANFSNYSAWHNRSMLLSKLLRKGSEGYFPKEKALSEEYEHVHSAVFTDPDDQSGWFYHLWLLDQTVKTDAPILVSSWPSSGSNITLQGDKCLHGYGFSLLSGALSDARTLPIILYFNQSVEGINSSTLVVKSELSIERDFVGKPLSTSNLKTAQVWVTYLNLRNIEFHPSKTCPVEISVGHSRESDSIVSVDELPTENDLTPTTSNWYAEIIANEITVFQELLSLIDCKIGKLTLARLLTANDSVSSPLAKRMVHAEEVLELHSDLMKLGPTHSIYYRDEHSLTVLRRVIYPSSSVLNV
ncbi:hypothetical protein L6164_030156 [Bauhinia variegata]|uniref:Uncharacterized protein n=1 Tax=Bauhinia variegata TaxID=167791 RepID=A0ACB9LBU1_BAUVA|nr:hypothetical protein L6164_030156 [Bauhinia variegata]